MFLFVVDVFYRSKRDDKLKDDLEEKKRKKNKKKIKASDEIGSKELQ